MARKAIHSTLHDVMAAFRAPEKAEKKSTPQPQTPIWPSIRRGKLVETPISDMPDGYLMAAIKFLQEHAALFQKRTLEQGISVDNFLRNHQSLDYTATQLKTLAKLSPQEFIEQETILPKMYEEAKRRKMLVLRATEWGGFQE